VLTTEDDAKVPTLASVWRQLEKFLWPEIHKFAKLLDWSVIGRDRYTRDEMMTQSIRVGLSEAFAVSSSAAALIEGAHGARLFYVFDESKAIPDPMWDAAEGAFSTENATMLSGRSGLTQAGECYFLAISTPGLPIGRFFDIHMRKPGYEDWKVRHVTIDEAIAAGRVSPEWVEQRRKQWGENSPMFQNRVLGEFSTQTTDSTIPYAWVEAAVARWEDWDDAGRPMSDIGIRKIGVDTARMGDDATVFAERLDNRIIDLHKYAKLPVTDTAGYLKPLAHRASETLIEMDSGLGAAVYDILQSGENPYERTMNLVPVYMGAGTSATDRTGLMRFVNVRSASWWHMRELLDPENGHEVMLPPDEDLRGDLVAPKYELKHYHGELTIFIEPKENLKKASRLGRSTDCGDAVVLAFWDDPGSGGGVVF